MLAELIAPLKALHLNEMAQGLSELIAEQERQPPLPEHWLKRLIEAEQTERQVRTLRSQLRAARFPLHRELARFDFAESPLSEWCLRQLATAAFTATAHNLIFIGGRGREKVTWRLPSAWQPSRPVNGCGSTTSLISSITWSRKSNWAKQDRWPAA